VHDQDRVTGSTPSLVISREPSMGYRPLRSFGSTKEASSLHVAAAASADLSEPDVSAPHPRGEETAVPFKGLDRRLPQGSIIAFRRVCGVPDAPKPPIRAVRFSFDGLNRK
jgi:hypothetical protein